MITPEQFWDLVKKKTVEIITENVERLDIIKFGEIPAGYAAGRPTVKFDGEAAATARTYPYLSSYAPAVGHRVALVRAGHTWLIIGRVL